MIKTIITTTLAIVGWTLFLGLSTVQAAESSTFHYDGVVVDETTKPMEGVTVTVIGTDRTTKTDSKGVFDITGNVPAGLARIADFPLLEISAKGYESSVIRCDSLSATGSTVMIWPLLNPKEGDRVDIARWAYIYRKGYAGNPPETHWLPVDHKPDNNMLCGLMWEHGNTVIGSVELEFAGTTPDPEQLIASSIGSGNWWLLDTPAVPPRDHSLAPEHARWKWQSAKTGQLTTTTNLPSPELRSPKITFEIGKHAMKVAIRSIDSDKNLDRYTVHAYVGAGPDRWPKPLDIEIEWGFQEGGNRQRWDGYMDAYQGHVTGIQPLSATSVAMTGQRLWQDNPNSKDRRGIQARIWSTGSAIVTLWTSGGNVSFLPSDLESGPILIPSVGIYITKRDSGLTAAQCQKQLADSGKKTISQRVREHSELNWTKAMNAVYPDKTLPPIPQVPTDKLPGMLIDVPEKQLNDQWRLSAANIRAKTYKQPDGTYIAAIWGGATALASESFQVVRALDLVGLPSLAEGSLNYWLQSAKAVVPKGNVVMRDNYREHKEGHGRIQATAGFHYWMTRNDVWVGKVLPELLASFEYTQQLRKEWSGQFPRSSWSYGLLPPYALSGDLGGYRMSCRLNAGFFEGMREIAAVVTLSDRDRGRIMQQEANEYREAIRRSLDRATALTPVIKVQDGTYRRYMPYGPYARGNWEGRPKYDLGGGFANYHDNLGNGLSVCWRGVYAPDEAIVQDTFDVVEDVFLQNKGKSAEPWFDLSGYRNQCGHEPQSFAHFLAGDVPLAIRAMYTGYASEILPNNGYRFQEHPSLNGFTGTGDKTFEEAAFLERVRMMLVQEEGDNLWLSRFSLREWFEQGKKISVSNSPTFFGPVDYEIISDVDNGKINATVKMPARNPPKEVRLSLRHPKTAPIKNVTVNGKGWKEYNNDKEYITLKGLTGTVAVTAQY